MTIPSNKTSTSGKEEDEWGVKPTPGFEVTLTDEERKEWLTGRRARDIVASKDGAISDKLREKRDASFHDKVLDRALEHIRQQLAAKKPHVSE